MGQRRVDREWPNPRNTRWCLVTAPADDRFTPPAQALVIAWTRRRWVWWALIVRVDEDGPDTKMVQEWVPLDRLRPVREDINKLLKYSGFSELRRPRGP